jgi:hypothetical protein
MTSMNINVAERHGEAAEAELIELMGYRNAADFRIMS